MGIKTAKEIIELRQGLPGERFSKLDQLKAVKRIDWDEVFSTGEVLRRIRENVLVEPWRN